MAITADAFPRDGVFRDTILDFNRAQGDKVNLSTIDADMGITGDEAFVSNGAAAFSGAHELRFDKVSDFDIHFDDAVAFQTSDFVL